MTYADDFILQPDITLLDGGRNKEYAGHQPTTGFTSPANMDFRRPLDLNDKVVTNQDSTWYIRMSTDAMMNDPDNIRKGDHLIVDSSRTPQTGHLTMSWAEGGYRIRRLVIYEHMKVLLAANDLYLPLYLDESSDYVHFGVVTHIFRKASKVPDLAQQL